MKKLHGRPQELAARALRCGFDLNWFEAGDLMQQVIDEFGTDGIHAMVRLWYDTAAEHLHGTDEPIDVTGIDIEDLDTGQTNDVETATPEVVWASRLWAAHLAHDDDMFNALLAALPQDDTTPDDDEGGPDTGGLYIQAALRVAAGMLIAEHGYAAALTLPGEQPPGITTD